MPKLLVDKPSGNKKAVYGKAGCEVIVVKDYGDVLIVQYKECKFSVRRSEIEL